MDSSGMWSLHNVSVIVAISALFSFSISDSSYVCVYDHRQVPFSTWHLYIVVAPGSNWRLGQRSQTRSCND